MQGRELVAAAKEAESVFFLRKCFRENQGIYAWNPGALLLREMFPDFLKVLRCTAVEPVSLIVKE
jgi:hypothetical protein